MAVPMSRYRVAVMLARIALFIVLDCLIVKVKQGFGVAITSTQLVMTFISAASFQVLLERMGGLVYAMYWVSGETVQESTITSLGLEEDVDGFVEREGEYSSDWILLRQVRMLWRRGWDVLAGAVKLEKETDFCIFCRRRVSKDWLSCQFHESYVFRDEYGEGAGTISAKKMDANELRNVITKVSKRVRRPFSTEVVCPTATNSEQVNVTLSNAVWIDLMLSNPAWAENLDFDPIWANDLEFSTGFVLEPEEMVFEFKDSLQASKYSAETANHKREKSLNVMTIQETPVTGEMPDHLEPCEERSTAYLTEAKWIMTHHLKRKFSDRIHPCPFEVLQYRPVSLFDWKQTFQRVHTDLGAFYSPAGRSFISPAPPPPTVHISHYIPFAMTRIIKSLRTSFEKTPTTRFEKIKPTLHDKFICYYCSRVLRRDRFAKRQVSGEFLPGHANALKRFCIDCGIKNKTFKPGNQITIHGFPFRICHDCSIPTLGRFCTQCNTCGSCLGQGGYSGPPNAKCPRCDHKTLRLHVDQSCRELLGNLEEQTHQVRALVNILGACMCEDCSRCMDELIMKPKAMDIVQQGLQYEVYHFSQIGKLRLSRIPQHWAPAIVRDVGGNKMRIGFEDPRLNLAEGTGIPEACYLKECGSVEQLVDMISKGRRTRIPGF